MHTPVFLFGNDNVEFSNKVREDIIATIEFLYKRGMWSKFHYDFWLKEAKKMNNAEKLHLWWDDIVSGSMFEVESPLEEQLEAEGEKPLNGKEIKKKAKQDKMLNF